MTIFIIAALLVVGFIFLAVEFFLVPGFSIPGISGLALIGYGIYKASIEYGSSGALITVLSSVVVTIILIRVSLKSRMVHNIALDYNQTGTTAVDDYSDLMGKTGKALSTLRPTGTAVIDDKQYSVVTDGEFIEANSDIIVSKIDGTRIVVTHIERR